MLLLLEGLTTCTECCLLKFRLPGLHSIPSLNGSATYFTDHAYNDNQNLVELI